MLGSRHRGRSMHRRHRLGHSRGVSARITDQPDFGLVSIPKDVTVRGPLGIADQAHVKLDFSDTNSYTGSGGGAAFIMALNDLFEPLGPAFPSCGYFDAWAKFYNFFRVEAAQVSLVFVNNSTSQQVCVVAFPSVQPVSNIPTTLDQALLMPDSKSMWVENANAGNPQRELKFYISFKRLWDQLFDQGPTFAGLLPSIPNSGAGASPSQQFYFYCMIFTTNESGAGTLSFDTSAKIKFYTTLFSTVMEPEDTTVGKSSKWLKDNPDWVPAIDPSSPVGIPPCDAMVENKPFLGKWIPLDQYHDPPKPPDHETLKPNEDFVDLSKSDIQTLKSVLNKVK